MRIPEHNWETGNVESREYPDHLFEPLVVWLLTTHAWLEDPSRVERHVLNLRRELAAHRNPPDTHREAEAFLAPAPSPAEALAERRRANLAKARAAKQAKRELVHAEG